MNASDLNDLSIESSMDEIANLESNILTSAQKGNTRIKLIQRIKDGTKEYLIRNGFIIEETIINFFNGEIITSTVISWSQTK